MTNQNWNRRNKKLAIALLVAAMSVGGSSAAFAAPGGGMRGGFSGGPRQEGVQGGMSGENSGRPELPENSENGERPELPENSENGERPELPENSENGERPELPENSENGERPELPENGENSGKGRHGRPVSGDFVPGEDGERPERPEDSENSGKGRHGRPVSGDFVPGEDGERPERPENSENSGKGRHGRPVSGDLVPGEDGERPERPSDGQQGPGFEKPGEDGERPELPGNEQGREDQHEERQSMTSANMIKGEKLDLMDGPFAEFADDIASFTSSNKRTAKVNKKGVVSGKKAGEAEITALDEDGNTLGTYQVTITAKPKLNLPKKVTTDTETINAADYLTGGDETVLPDKWTSSKESVAEIDESTGEITVNGKGTTTITAYYGNVKVSKRLKVKSA
ncbi:MAG: Ig-like domain-containing protein [Lachnospiraceae bacterium]|nr:Ig-like domain-containing protein [Lachnospiraceae bacterium]